MNKIKQVLALSDLSSDLTTPVKAGALTAEKFGAKLILLHVIEDAPNDYGIFTGEIQAKLKEEARRGLESSLQVLGKSGVIPVMSEVRVGAPFEEIAKAVKEHKVDLIVCGVGRGEGSDPTSEHLGIIAKRLAHKLPVDIFFVRKGHEGPAKSILVATDFSDCSSDAMNRAIDYAKASKLKSVRVVSAYSLPDHWHLTGHSEDEVKAKMKEHSERHGKEWLAKINTQGVTVEMVYRLGSPANMIIKEAKDMGADRIFVGSHGRTASSAVLLGNVAERVIRGAHCSVWAERSDGQAMNFASAIARLMGLS